MPTEWIDTADRLEQFLGPLAAQGGLLALDTEFLRADTYYPRLCLVQLARTDGRVALVDPLVCSLTPLWTVWQRPDITVILHAAFQDLEVLYQAGGTLPARIFDTQIAALLHGHGDRSGLAQLLAHFLDIHLPKDAARTPWCQRPLSDRQRAYAANDVRHLIPLYHALNEPLSPAARTALAEDFDDLLQPTRYDTPPERAWERIAGHWKLNSRQHTLLRALAAWREHTARQENRPRRWIISDETLLAMARRPPANRQKLYGVPGMTDPQRQQYGDAILQCLDETFARGQWQRPEGRAAPPSPAEETWLLPARAIVRQQAHHFGFPARTFTDPILLDWARNRQGPLARGWRHLLLGEPLAQFQHGKLALKWNLVTQRLEVPHAPIFSA